MNSYTQGMISILCPTRGRPDNVVRKVQSILSTASEPNLVEILFYVDLDDYTFPNEILEFSNVKKVVGPRMWLSILQNVLYAQASGEIIMYSGDDVVFESNNWDKMVRNEFSASEDKILLVYGSDGGYYGEKIALHGFLHREWINAVGCWVQPGRAVPYDYWHTENARQIGRLRYLNNVKFKHIHFRQGDAVADFDRTYADVSNLHNAFRPLETYKLVERERRIDRILLIEKMIIKPRLELRYLFSEFFSTLPFLELDSLQMRRIKTFKNHSLILYLIKILLTNSINRVNKLFIFKN